MSLRQIARALIRGRSYALAAILTMAVGLAATTAVVAVANAVVLRPLPYPNPDRLFRLNASTRTPPFRKHSLRCRRSRWSAFSSRPRPSSTSKR